MNGEYLHKIKYVQAYIHHMKGASVQIRLPQSPKEELLLNQAYTIAIHTMKLKGQTFNV